jgi:carbonic anhydrase
MHTLVDGIRYFQRQVLPAKLGLFQRLAAGQQPVALFITCSDSRINPNLITHTEPGDLFILRNAGNIIPAHGAANGGEGATIEFAVVGLGISDIIVCGHTHCGAIKGLLYPETLQQMPTVSAWLSHAQATRQVADQKYANLPPEVLVNLTVQENVLVQLENLRTHPAVAAALARDNLKLHGWVYKIETGQVFTYHPDAGQFVALTERLPAPIAPPAQLKNACSV